MSTKGSSVDTLATVIPTAVKDEKGDPSVDENSEKADSKKANEAHSLNDEEDLRILKQEKAIKKCAFTKMKNKLQLELEDDLPSRRKVRELMCAMIEAEEAAVDVMQKMCKVNKKKEDQEELEKLSIEMEKIHAESQTTERQGQDHLDSRLGEESSIASSKVAWSQRQEIKARQMADRVRAEVQKQELQYQKAKLQLEEDFKQKTLMLEKNMKIEQERLDEAELQLDECRAALERDLNDELGLSKIKPEPHRLATYQKIKFPSHSASDKQELGMTYGDS